MSAGVVGSSVGSQGLGRWEVYIVHSMVHAPKESIAEQQAHPLCILLTNGSEKLYFSIRKTTLLERLGNRRKQAQTHLGKRCFYVGLSSGINIYPGVLLTPLP